MDGLAKSAPAFEVRLQESIAGEVERSFRTIARSTLEVFLGGAFALLLFLYRSSPFLALAGSADTLASKRGWTVKGSDVELPQDDSNTPKASVTHERIEVERAWLCPFIVWFSPLTSYLLAELARLLSKSQA